MSTILGVGFALYAAWRIGAARATLYMYLQPFLGALFAAILLGEQITALQVAGGAVIVLGVSLGQLMPGATVRE